MKRVLITLSALICTLALSAQTLLVAENPQTDAVYRLPLAKGVQVVATSLTPVQLGLGRSNNLVDFCAWELTTTKSGAVFAPRAGVVEEALENRILIRHEDGIYTHLRGLESVSVAQGAKIDKGNEIGTAGKNGNKWSVWMEVFFMRKNEAYGTVAQSGNSELLKQYINPIFTTRNKCKVLLTDGNSYTVKTRTWCWPWE